MGRAVARITNKIHRASEECDCSVIPNQALRALYGMAKVVWR